VYVGAQGVLTGSARQAQEAKERADGAIRHDDLEQQQIDLARRRASVEAQVEGLWRDFETQADIVERLVSSGSAGTVGRADQRAEQSRMRHADVQDTDGAPRRDGKVVPV
jgi:circadian clock protein KaiC